MSLPTPPASRPPLAVPSASASAVVAGPKRKLLVIRFLNEHLAQGGVDQNTYNVLHRMILIISAMGRDVHTIIQSRIAHVNAIQQLQVYADCLLQGCSMFRRHFHRQGSKVHQVASSLSRLDGLEGEELSNALKDWLAALETLYMPTGNNGRLFEHLMQHYDTSVYEKFLQFHRRKPDSPVWTMNEQLTAIKHALSNIREDCKVADGIVLSLEAAYDLAARRYRRWLRQQIRPIVAPSAVTEPSSPQRGSKAAKAMLSSPQSSPILHGPPQIPPLPFECSSTATSVEAEVKHSLDHAKHPGVTQSFSMVEDRLQHSRTHHRSSTLDSVSFVAAARGSIAKQPLGGLGVGAQRRGSSNVPRVFTGSFSELESEVHRLELHKVKTPEAPPGTPVDIETYPFETFESPVKVQDFADSPVNPMLKVNTRECSNELPIASEGQVVQSARQIQSLSSPRSQALDDASSSLEDWLRQQDSNPSTSCASLQEKGSPL